MKPKKNTLKKITPLILITFLILSSIPLLIVSYASVKTSEDVLIEYRISQFQSEGIHSANAVTERINTYIKQLEVLKETGPIKEYRHTTQENLSEELLENLNENLEEFAYGVTQLRLLSEDGMEVTRINVADEIKEVVPREQLQNKSDRYYFIETVDLKDGKTFISRIDLNKEGNPPKIQLPYAPTIRIAIPLKAEDGSNRGILIANINSDLIFNKLYNEDSNENEVLLDPEGYYLLHTDNTKPYGGPNDLNTGEGFYKDHPEVAQQILTDGQLESVEFKNQIFIPTIIRPSQDNLDNYWIEVSIINKDKALTSTNDLVSNTLSITLSGLFAIFIFSAILSKLIGDPIKKLSEEIDIISSGNLDFTVSVPNQEELSGIAKAFNKMTVTLKEYRDYLDKKVESKTTKLESLTENMVGRELKMIELKKEINELKKKNIND